MPNYILSRTSPPAHIYERKINLGYGVKVDVSDAPTEPKKEKKMNDVKEVLDVADKPVATAAFADGTVLTDIDAPLNAERIRADLEAKAAEEAEEYPPFSKQQV